MTEEIFHSGYVAIVGRPNVGKSTLVNALLGQKIAAVSPRPQTTRRRQLGILTLENAQVVFVDTPGLHIPQHKLGEFMNEEAIDALQDADLVAWLVDCSEPPTDEDRLIAARLGKLRRSPRVLLVLNKVDLIPDSAQKARLAEFLALYPPAQPVFISAAGGEGRKKFLETVLELLPVGAPFFDEEQVTDLYEREIAVDLIRQAALIHLREEIPHALGVRIDEYKERSEDMDYIAATLLVERETHKGMVIGKGGEMIKHIGSTARTLIEEMTGRKAFLELRVKVSENWRDDPSTLRALGYLKKRE
jgi:GTP-binding protein Era